jgi:hypothetical protein
MVTTESLEGMIDGTIWYHYDRASDVLYLRRWDQREVETVAEETPAGLLLLRRSDTDEVVGLTVVNWWRRFGAGPLPDSIRELEQHLGPWSAKVADPAPTP